MNQDLQNWWNKIRESDARKVLLEQRNEIHLCPFCNANIKDRNISIYEELIGQLYEIYKWCGEHRLHEFTTKEVRHFFDHNGYARFNDLIRCSNGILYRPEGEDESMDRVKRGKYGMHMARAKEFFQGKRPIHLSISLNQITGEKQVLKDVFIGQIPPLKELLDAQGLYDHEKLI